MSPLFLISYVFVCCSLANSEYYKLLMRNGQDERRDASVCTLQELERVTSEHTLKNTVYIHTQAHTQCKHTHTRYTCTCKFIFASRLAVCVSVCVFTAFVCVCDLARLCACVFLHVRAYVSLCLCVGLLRCGFLAVEWPCDVRVGAGSQHPVLQEEVPGVNQVCGAALPPRC